MKPPPPEYDVPATLEDAAALLARFAAEDGRVVRLLVLIHPHLAHRPIRARGTFCGSLADADSASVWCLLAVALDAIVELRSGRGAPTIPENAVCLGYMSTAMEADEIVTAALLPALPEGETAVFRALADAA